MSPSARSSKIFKLTYLIIYRIKYVFFIYCFFLLPDSYGLLPIAFSSQSVHTAVTSCAASFLTGSTKASEMPFY